MLSNSSLLGLLAVTYYTLHHFRSKAHLKFPSWPLSFSPNPYKSSLFEKASVSPQPRAAAIGAKKRTVHTHSGNTCFHLLWHLYRKNYPIKLPSHTHGWFGEPSVVVYMLWNVRVWEREKRKVFVEALRECNNTGYAEINIEVPICRLKAHWGRADVSVGVC